ncbi:MAG TPA: lipoprotein [Xanthobacteraceae bacterium]|nr:lipoprotein [Xanthobacteraceae bacterium]
MTRSSDRLPIRLAAVAMLIAACGLAACGRKGALEPPPSAQLAEPQPAAAPEARRSPADVLVGTPGARETPQQTTQQAAAPKKHFFLDWLLD